MKNATRYYSFIRITKIAMIKMMYNDQDTKIVVKSPPRKSQEICVESESVYIYLKTRKRVHNKHRPLGPL